MKALAFSAGSALHGLTVVMADQQLAFTPVAGTRLSKRFEATFKLDVDKLTITRDGEERYPWLLDLASARAHT